jgi:hypothetical protein
MNEPLDAEDRKGSLSLANSFINYAAGQDLDLEDDYEPVDLHSRPTTDDIRAFVSCGFRRWTDFERYLAACGDHQTYLQSISGYQRISYLILCDYFANYGMMRKIRSPLSKTI